MRSADMLHDHDRLLCLQAHVLRRHFWRANLIGAGTTILLAALVADATPAPLMTLWLGASALCYAAHAIYCLTLTGAADARAAARQLRQATAWCAAFSLLLCCGMLAFQPFFHPDQQFVLYSLPFAATLQAMLAVSVYLPASHALILPVIVANLVLQIGFGRAGVPEFIVISAVVPPVLLLQTWRLNQLTLAGIASRGENVVLMRKLQAQMLRAESLAEAKTGFVNAANHDLRQHMHALSMYLAVLTLQGHGAPRGAEMLERAAHCANNLDQLFHALIEIARLDADAVKPDCSQFRLAPLLDQLRLEFHLPSQELGRPLRIAPSRAVATGDPALVAKMLRCLIDNALRHGGHGRVLLACRRRGQRMTIAVYDNGIGIAEAEQARLFDEFCKFDDPELNRRKGMGLGLATAQRLAHLLGTRISVHSRPGRGSCFAFELPCDGAEAAPLPAAAIGTLALLIEDDPVAAELAGELLRKWDFTVVAAVNSADAIRQLAHSARAPDIILSDYHLLDERAPEAIAAVCDEFNRTIPALIMTSDTSVRGSTSEGIIVLHKPVAGRLLHASIQRLLPLAL